MRHTLLAWSTGLLLLPIGILNAQSICEIQGSGASSPFTGQQVTTEGIVTAVFTGSGTLGGYFIEQPDCDANAATSNGVFVYNPSQTSLSVGQHVQVSGQVVEFNGVTEITNASAIVLGTGSVTATDITFPLASVSQWEQYEGMFLRFPATLTVTDNQGWVQYGELLMASTRQFTPTNFIDPNDAVASGTTSIGANNVAAINMEVARQDRSRILLDDGRTSTYPSPLPWVSSEGTLRTGSTMTGLQGVLHYSFGEYRLEPVGVVPVVHAARPAVPSVGGSIRAASLNVLNYWTTLGGWGAANSGELGRQRTKLIAALQAMNADVFALHELENNDVAWADLLSALNNAVGAGSYAALEVDAFGSGGTKSVIFYRTTSLTPITNLFSINGSPFQRPHITQGFSVNNGGGRFLFSTAHMRSKLCDNATGGNQDQGDGQGCYNDNRREQALGLVDHWAGLRNSTGIDAQLIMGDFNAYTEEDPLDIFRANGLDRLLDGDEYSYSYQGTFGSLDHAIGNSSMVDAVTDAVTWHINSDEPERFDYTDGNISRYQPNAFRCSDHDPIVVGMNSMALNVGMAEGPDPSTATLIPTQEGTAIWRNSNPSVGYSRLAMYDARGVLVTQQRINGNGDVIDLRTLGPGLYLWRADGPTGVSVHGKVVLGR